MTQANIYVWFPECDQFSPRAFAIQLLPFKSLYSEFVRAHDKVKEKHIQNISEHRHIICIYNYIQYRYIFPGVFEFSYSIVFSGAA